MKNNAITKNKGKIKTIVFYICYILMLLETFFRHTPNINSITHTVFIYIALPLLILLCILNFFETQQKGKIIIAILIVFGFLTKFISNNNLILILCLFICAFKDLKFDTLLKISIYTKIILLIIIGILYFNGLTDYEAVIEADGRIRHSMGFGNPNTFSTYVFSVVIQSFYLHRKKIKIFDILIFLAGVTSIIIFTHSKTQLICIALAIGIFFIKKFLSKDKIPQKIIRGLMYSTFLICAVISILSICMYMIDPVNTKTFNEITSKRLSSAATVVKQNNGITIFGKDIDRSIKNKEDGIRVLDNGYIYILLYFGLFSIITFSTLFFRYNKQAIRKGDSSTAWALVIYAISGVAERFFIEIAANIFLLRYSDLIYQNETKSIQIKEEKC